MMDISTTPQELATSVTRDAARSSSSTLSFEAFYGANANSIAQALAVTLGDADLAFDATNEAMTRAFQRWSKISAYDNPAAWVYRVGLNWSLSWKARRRREQERPVRLAPERTEARQRDDSLDAALDELSVERRAVVVCRIYLDWSVDQTADALGVAPGTVKSRLARALAELREAIDPLEGAQR